MKSKDIVTYLYAPHSPATFPANYCNPAKHVRESGLTPSGSGVLGTLYLNCILSCTVTPQLLHRPQRVCRKYTLYYVK